MSFSDFDNDGFDDLIVGVRGQGIGAAARAGAAGLLYGSGSGITAVGNQVWHQNVSGVEGVAATDDSFASALAGGDFNGDGFDDLAIGTSGEDIGAAADAGAVNLLRGSAAGLTAVGNQLGHQDTPGILETAESGDAFGSALAVGDFDADGFDDLAIGAPGESVGAASRAGLVNALYGSASGLTAARNQVGHQDVAGVGGTASNGDRYGSALAVGDFDDDGFDDLAIGVVADRVGAAAKAGAVNTLYGSEAGLTTAGNQTWHQNVATIPGSATTGDQFGSALAVGDFDGDGFDDLAIGAPGEGLGLDPRGAGSVNALYGSAAGLSAAGNQLWHQNIAGVLGSAASGDGYGSALAVGDFNNDGFDDLAVGVPGEDVGSATDAGAVSLLYGSDAGLTATGNQLGRQGFGVSGAAESFDFFGSSVSTGDYNGDGFDDLAIGATGEDIGDVSDAGTASVLFGSASGIVTAGNELWHQDIAGVLGSAETGDLFGGPLG